MWFHPLKEGENGPEHLLLRMAVIAQVVHQFEGAEGIKPAVELAPQALRIAMIGLEPGERLGKILPDQITFQFGGYFPRTVQHRLRGAV